MDNENENKVIDWKLAEKLVGGNRVLAQEMMYMLREHLPNHLEEITLAYQENNLEKLKDATHKLHGATCYCGTPRLKLAARNLEMTLKNNKTKDVHKLYNELCIEINAVLNS